MLGLMLMLMLMLSLAMFNIIMSDCDVQLKTPLYASMGRQ